MFSVGEILGALLISVIRFAPSFFVGTIGLWLAIRRRKHHPRVSKFAIIGFSALLLVVGIGLVLQLSLISLEDSESLEPVQVSELIAYFNWAVWAVNLFALSAICAAVFVERGYPKQR